MSTENTTEKQQEYSQIVPDIGQWPIYELSSNRYEFIHEVREATIKKILEALPDDASLVEELARTLYQERIRINEKPWKADPDDEQEYWGFV